MKDFTDTIVRLRARIDRIIEEEGAYWAVTPVYLKAEELNDLLNRLEELERELEANTRELAFQGVGNDLPRRDS